MSEPTQPPFHQPTILQQVIAHLDSCREAEDDIGATCAEQALADLLPSCIFDIFALLPKLADKSLSETTREQMLANMIRATKFIEIEFENVVQWFQVREAGVADFKASYSVAAGHLVQAQEKVASTRSILAAITGDKVAELAGVEMAHTASDLDLLQSLMSTASMQLDNPGLAEIKAKNDADRSAFEEVLAVAKRQ